MASVEGLLEVLEQGRPLPNESGRALLRLIGVKPGLEGLSRLFTPGFPGVRAFAVDVHAAPDQAVDLTLVGVARDGRPVWTGTRAFALGRDGSLELHIGFDEIAPEYQSRNITVDLVQRQLDLLALIGRGARSRLTIDADNVGRYVCALHGFIFADETEEGPPVRSARALAPAGDRHRLIGSAIKTVEQLAKRRHVGRISLEATLEALHAAEDPWSIAELSFGASEIATTDDGEMGVGDVGREILLSSETLNWRGALYLKPKVEHQRAAQRGLEYRRRKTLRSETRLASDLQSALEDVETRHRPTRVKALKHLGLHAPSWMASEVRNYTRDPDRRVAQVARQALRQIQGTDLAERMLSFAEDEGQRTNSRALVYRVLAEYFPKQLEGRVSKLRVNPDARIQRAVVPQVAAGLDQARSLASFLSANPWEPDPPRPGLLALRLELIDRLRTRAEPSTLPVLMKAIRARPEPSPPERLALSRALLAFSDPRAQAVLMEAAERLERPPVP